MDREKTIDDLIAEASRINNVSITYKNEPNFALMAKAVLEYIEEESRS
jgi:hypothetical protein